MGLLFVFEDDDTAKGASFALGLQSHSALMVSARAAKGAFPLVRRLSDFYRDTSFDLDELEPLTAELRLLRAVEPDCVEALLNLAWSAFSANLGLLVISD